MRSADWSKRRFQFRYWFYGILISLLARYDRPLQYLKTDNLSLLHRPHRFKPYLKPQRAGVFIAEVKKCPKRVFRAVRQCISFIRKMRRKISNVSNLGHYGMVMSHIYNFLAFSENWNLWSADFVELSKSLFQCGIRNDSRWRRRAHVKQWGYVALLDILLGYL